MILPTELWLLLYIERERERVVAPRLEGAPGAAEDRERGYLSFHISIIIIIINVIINIISYTIIIIIRLFQIKFRNVGWWNDC